MAAQPLIPGNQKPTPLRRAMWLRKHSDYQRVYREGKRQSLPLMTYFFLTRDPSISHPSQEREGWGTREEPGVDLQLPSRIGITSGKVLGGAVERNRIKRRIRAAVRLHYVELGGGIDVVLHPRRQMLDTEFAAIERDLRRAFQTVMAAVAKTCDAGSNRS